MLISGPVHCREATRVQCHVRFSSQFVASGRAAEVGIAAALGWNGIPAALADLAPEVRRNGLHVYEGIKVFAEVYGPPPRLIVVGAVDTAEALCAAAGLLGWHTICVDPRAVFATPERIPSADELVLEWPDEALAKIAPDHNTAVVVLAHA